MVRDDAADYDCDSGLDLPLVAASWAAGAVRSDDGVAGAGADAVADDDEPPGVADEVPGDAADVAVVDAAAVRQSTDASPAGCGASGDGGAAGRQTLVASRAQYGAVLVAAAVHVVTPAAAAIAPAPASAGAGRRPAACPATLVAAAGDTDYCDASYYCTLLRLIDRLVHL